VTESTDAPRRGAAHPNDSQDLVADFLARHAGLLEKIYGFIVRRMKDDDADTGGVYTETVKSFVGYLAKRGWKVQEEDYTPLLFRIATRRISDSRRAHGRAWGPAEMAVNTDLELLSA
jgi:DNA-directed RNA polymerase specialized sigma24 family protein